MFYLERLQHLEEDFESIRLTLAIIQGLPLRYRHVIAELNNCSMGENRAARINLQYRAMGWQVLILRKVH